MRFHNVLLSTNWNFKMKQTAPISVWALSVVYVKGYKEGHLHNEWISENTHFACTVCVFSWL